MEFLDNQNQFRDRFCILIVNKYQFEAVFSRSNMLKSGQSSWVASPKTILARRLNDYDEAFQINMISQTPTKFLNSVEKFRRVFGCSLNILFNPILL